MTSRETTGLLALDEDERPRRRWRDRLWVIVFGAIQWPWLLRSLWGGSRRARAALLHQLGLPASALPNLGSWKADVHFLGAILDHVARHQPRTVVEFGAGATTLVLARALQQRGGGRLLSLDQHGGFVTATRAWLAGHGLHPELRHAPLADVPQARERWYETGPLPERIDMLVIDGPPWAVHPLVRAGAERLFDRIPVGGAILLDDARRPGERIVARGWRRRWPGFRFHRIARGAGVLVGVRER